MIPFLVADRPASLRIIKGARHHGPLGLMSHANASPLFRRLYRDYPCGENPCHALDPSGDTDCPFAFDGTRCDVAQSIRARTPKMCDCGMFTKEGAQYSYQPLFHVYDDMGADYGVMLDVFGNRSATVKSAVEALGAYRSAPRRFKLVLVAQGDTRDEYLRCYEQLRNLGGEYIAVGGLLQRRENSSRYVRVRSEDLMREVLGAIRQRFNPDWLFALGCYHPKRHKQFTALSVWGSDHKGWIFAYKKRERLIQGYWEGICCHLAQVRSCNPRIKTEYDALVAERRQALVRQERSEYHTSRRGLPVDDRPAALVELDERLAAFLGQVRSAHNLDGATPPIDQAIAAITELTRMTEQELRFAQVRRVLTSYGAPAASETPPPSRSD